MSTTPTQRSLKYLRDNGYTAEVVEHFNSFTNRRNDLFGFGDILAIKPDEILIVQTTSTSNLAARQTKINESEAASHWLNAGGKIHLHGWSKKGPRGKRKLWTLTEREFHGSEA